VLQTLGTPKADTLDDVLALDAAARRVAQDLLPVHAV
jgi:1-deoxy-D-xylulose-5-phosphate reductoisomerase